MHEFWVAKGRSLSLFILGLITLVGSHIFMTKVERISPPEMKEKILNKGFLPVDAEQRDASWLDTALVEDMLRDFPEYLPNTYWQYYFYPHYKTSKLNPTCTPANEVREGREIGWVGLLKSGMRGKKVLCSQ